MWCRTTAANSTGLAEYISIDPPHSSISAFPSTQHTTSSHVWQRGGARRCSVRRCTRPGVWRRHGDAARQAQTMTRSRTASWRWQPCQTTNHQAQWLLMEHKATLGLSLGIYYWVFLHHLNVASRDSNSTLFAAFQSVLEDDEETMVTYSTYCWFLHDTIFGCLLSWFQLLFLWSVHIKSVHIEDASESIITKD